jgi:hypothetical protein
MEELFTIEDVAGFYAEKGTPSCLGCDESEIEKWISYCEDHYADKGICTVKKWMIVECTYSEPAKAKLREMGLLPFVMHANCVVWDSKNRWRTGSFASSYFLVELSENCLFVTKNTAYILIGSGHKKFISPPMLYAILEGLSF